MVLKLSIVYPLLKSCSIIYKKIKDLLKAKKGRVATRTRISERLALG